MSVNLLSWLVSALPDAVGTTQKQVVIDGLLKLSKSSPVAPGLSESEVLALIPDVSGFASQGDIDASIAGIQYHQHDGTYYAGNDTPNRQIVLGFAPHRFHIFCRLDGGIAINSGTFFCSTWGGYSAVSFVANSTGLLMPELVANSSSFGYLVIGLQ